MPRLEVFSLLLFLLVKVRLLFFFRRALLLFSFLLRFSTNLNYGL